MTRSASPRTRRAPTGCSAVPLLLTLLALALSGCGNARLPPVFGAVFGLDGAETYPYRPGRVPEAAAGPGDRLIGGAASQPGQCIYADGGSARRFRADCPDGFSLSPE